jgi:phage terminase small subunit
VGLRGPAPQPTKIRILNGNPGRHPLPKNEPQYGACVPDRPAGMSPAGKKVWVGLVEEMAAVQVLRRVDALALAQLCEDQALLNEANEGLRKMLGHVKASAKQAGKDIPGNALVMLMQDTKGRRMMSSIRELANAVVLQRREFGLTPASNSRVATHGTVGGFIDALEQKLCG